MEVEGHSKAASSPTKLRCLTDDDSPKLSISAQRSSGRKPGGWKSMPYILGNETFERLASMGLIANFMVYLIKVYHIDQVSATTLINVWTGVTNFLPLLGAFLSDAYVGRYWTIAVASVFSLFGMASMTLTAWLPALHPPACGGGKCEGPTPFQMGFLIMSLCLVSIGSGGIRPCSIPFGVDQFDPTTDAGRKGIASFYNWYYATFNVVLVVTLTIVVYIQDSVSWVLGYGIPTALMFCSIVLFFMGTHVYVFIKPEGSVFTGLVQVAVAAYKKRKVELPSLETNHRTAFYDPPLEPGSVVLSKLPLTDQFRFLNKAAVVMEKELNPDGKRTNKWNLSTIQQVEEFKCLIRVAPIWVTGILSLTPMLQQATFSISQALLMDRRIGPNFHIPPASIIVISFLTITLFVPIYDRFLVPFLRKFTHHQNGITQLQRMAVGIIFAVLSMVIAGLIEMARRNQANAGGGSMSVFWLTPQFFLMGLCEAFNIIGQIEFFNKEFPEHMRTMGNALSSCSIALSSYVSTALVLIVHRTTGGGGDGRADWLADDLNKGRLDYFYYIVAATAFFNFFLFLYCAKNYRYKGKESNSELDFELASSDKKLEV
ncbi:protein NRT1/ PTR FAMILY 2.13-like [Cucurbita pepo subsp. pepo]|uniref:protein NRT1/ PTR FAMILY 2.13-like n=1 Tax=Cucurbita pepo subsp. pepo TaxID=3664 RepID=UPI000C9D8519|nr:protein NRT1/ PTR FAMILY 2.13-like [Cucurbita pepo subsp. pepo]